MPEINLPEKIKNQVQDYTRRLKEIYGDGLISAILYGSSASGEFVDRHSNLNLLVVLADTSLENLKRSAYLISKFRAIEPLFLSEAYIASSTDIFPIEFLDMRENYLLLDGRDVLKNINIDTRNLRFQCEQELKVKLINLRQLYIRINKDKAALRKLLFKSFTSVLHVARNLLRLKGKEPAYKKEDILKALVTEFRIDMDIWAKVLAARSRQIKLDNHDIEQLFTGFIAELEKLVDIVDKL